MIDGECIMEKIKTQVGVGAVCGSGETPEEVKELPGGYLDKECSRQSP